MKKVLCIVSSLDTGGAETFMMKIFRKLPEQYSMDFVVSTNDGYYENEVIKLGGRIHRIPLRTKHPIRAFFELRSIVSENNYEYILKLCDTPIGLIDLLAAKLGGARKLCLRSCNASSNDGKVKNIVNIFLRPLLNKITDVKIAPSILAAEYTFGKKEVKNKNVYILKNAVDLDIFKYSYEGRKRIREEFGIGENAFVIGHIGRFSKQKNHRYLIRVFSDVLKINPLSKLLLVGEGELYEPILQQLKDLNIKDKTIFTGIRSDIADLLSSMDIFVFPSLYEGMPNTVIEAQATGLPCLISDTITSSAKITSLVEFFSLNSDPKDVSNDCIKLFNNNKTRKNYQDQITEQGYSIESTVSTFVKLIFN